MIEKTKITKSMRYDPNCPFMRDIKAGIDHYCNGNEDKARIIIKKAIRNKFYGGKKNDKK